MSQACYLPLRLFLLEFAWADRERAQVESLMAASESPSSEGHLTCLENVSDSARFKFRFHDNEINCDLPCKHSVSAVQMRPKDTKFRKITKGKNFANRFSTTLLMVLE
ncbi:hypothetical protein D5086_001127 [Populus alba]|uniref:Uncharacterized protein n=1 Tax=Populus alba TaxID=43335 RepID=A0ACC4CZ27_POPAL